MGKGCVTRPIVRHYLGFAHGRRKRLREPEPTVKHLLYAYRVYLSGIHLMRTGNVVANINVLIERFRLAEVDELVRRKREGAENCPMYQPLLRHWTTSWCDSVCNAGVVADNV